MRKEPVLVTVEQTADIKVAGNTSVRYWPTDECWLAEVIIPVSDAQRFNACVA